MLATALTILSRSPLTIFVGIFVSALPMGSVPTPPETFSRTGFVSLSQTFSGLTKRSAPVFAQLMPLPTTSPTVSFVQSHADSKLPRMPPDSRSCVPACWWRARALPRYFGSVGMTYSGYRGFPSPTIAVGRLTFIGFATPQPLPTVPPASRSLGAVGSGSSPTNLATLSQTDLMPFVYTHSITKFTGFFVMSISVRQERPTASFASSKASPTSFTADLIREKTGLRSEEHTSELQSRENLV